MLKVKFNKNRRLEASIWETKYWLLNRIFHRENGPAVEFSGGYKEWYLNGIRYYTEEEFNAKLLRRGLR